MTWDLNPGHLASASLMSAHVLWPLLLVCGLWDLPDSWFLPASPESYAKMAFTCFQLVRGDKMRHVLFIIKKQKDSWGKMENKMIWLNYIG